MNWGDERLPSAFWDKTIPEPNSGCWLWTGANSHGYGVIRMRGKNHPAHRLALSVVRWVPEDFDTDHLCRTPCCVNPAHLEAVPHSVNMRRSPLGFMNSETQRENARRAAVARMRKSPAERSELARKAWATKRQRYGKTGNTTVTREQLQERAHRAWQTRRSKP